MDKKGLVSKKLRRQRAKTNTGLSLVELLVVLTVIAILMGLLLPAAQRIRESSRRTVCANNMRQIAMRKTRLLARKGWENINICPVDPVAEIRIDNKYSSYCSNGFALDRKIETSMNSARTIILFESSENYPGLVSVEVGDWFEEGDPWDHVNLFLAPKRHSGNLANYAYADGHVQAIPAGQIKLWCDRRHDFGGIGKGGYFP